MITASIKFVTPRACVPCLGTDRESFPVRTCARLRWRAHGEINPGSQQARNPARHPSAVAPLSDSVIAAILPGQRRLLTARIERTQTQRALLAVSTFLQWGHTGFCNLFRAQSAGSSSRVAFVNDCRQPANRIRSTFEISPIILSSSALHANNKAWSKQHDVQRNSASGASNEFG